MEVNMLLFIYLGKVIFLKTVYRYEELSEIVKGREKGSLILV